MKKFFLLFLTMLVSLSVLATDYPGHPGFVGKTVYVDDDGFPCGEPQGDVNFQFAYQFEYGYLPGYDMPVAIMLRTQYLAENGVFIMPSYYNIVDPDYGTLMCKVIGIAADELFWFEYISNAVTTVTLPNELEFVVGNGALSFPHITSLTLPASLEYMDVKALNRCTMLTDLTVADSSKPLQILGTQSNSYGSLGAFGVPPLVNAYVGKNVIAEESPFKRTSGSTLKHVTLAGNGQLVYDKMFNQQNVLETATLKEGVGDIGEKAFYECRALTGISIPGTTTRIGKNAFAGDTTMTTVSLHEGLKYIDYRAFENCYKVGELYLPASLDSIHSEAFQGMSGVTKVTIADANNPLAFNYTRWYGNGAFDSFEAYTAYLGRNIELNYNAKPPFYSGGSRSMTALTIGNQVTTLPDYAFYCNRKLATATIGTGLTAISEYAFNECSGLTGISIPGNVKRIEKNAFAGDTTMTTVTLNEGLDYIGYRAFENCKKVGELYLPASLDSIHSEAFQGMSGVKKLTIADSDQPLAFNHTRWYNNGAFDSFEAYTAHLGRNIELTDRALSPFYSGGNINRSLTALTIGDQVTTLPNYAFYRNKNMATATIGTGLTAISEYAFNECSGLTGISIPGNVKRIEKNAFASDTTMTTVSLNEGLDYIGYRAFENCKKVGELYLPASLDSIHSEAFQGMSGVKKVTIADSDQPLAFNHTRWYNNGAFDSFEAYTAHLGRNIELTDRALSPFYSGGSRSMTALTIGDHVTTLPNYAFYRNKNMATATIGTGLTAISEYAFNECSALTGISIPGNVMRIEKNAFSGDTTMTAVTLNEGLVYIGYRAFENCKKVGELYLPASLDSIQSEAFQGMSGVTKVTIADSDQPLTFNHTRWYGNGAFNEMPLTTSLYIGRDLAVTDNALSPIYNNQTVVNITLGEEVTTILGKQFYNNDGLRHLTVNALEPPVCPDNAFNEVVIENITLTVPAASKPKYRVAPVWEWFFTNEETYGDVNGDGYVTAADVTAIYNYLLNGDEVGSAADVNGDGEVTVADITAIYNILLEQ